MPNNPIGLPKSADYELPPSLSENATSRFVSIAPNGITQTSSVPISIAPYVANSGGPLMPFVQQLIAFDIPCGGGFGSFIDPSQTTINFRLVWTTTAQVGGTSPQMNIISSLASFISSITLYSNNTPLETINNYDLIHALLLNSTLNLAQRQANAWQFGCDANTMTGIDLPTTTAGTYYFNASLPLISIIGVNGGDKLFPTGLIQNLQLQILTNQFMPISTYCTVIPTTLPVASAFLDSWSLGIKQIDLGEVAGNILRSKISGGMLYLKASSYVNSNTTLPSGSSGNQTIMLQIRNSSVKSVFTTIGTQALPAICPNFLYDSFNPNITSMQLSNPALGFRAPNRPLNPSQRPGECFNHFSMAWGSSIASSYGGVVSAETYHAIYPSIPLAGAYDARWVIPGVITGGLRFPYTNDDNQAMNIIQKYPNMFYMGFDTEKCSSTLFCGINTRSAPPQYDMTLNVAIGATLQVTTFGLIDVVCAFNIQTHEIMVYN
jgi:hypothetical protein